MHLPPLIADLALILGAAAMVTLLFKWLKQPLVLGYIIAGFLVGPAFSFFPNVTDPKNVQTWADIGVLFLLFGLGLEFSFKKLIRIGGTALITALIEAGLTMTSGFFLGKLLGWETMDCLFLGGLLGIASTTIIIRAFGELGVKSRKFAGVVLGVLVIEDLIAVVLLVLLSTIAVSRSFAGTEMLTSVVKLGFFLVLWFLSGIFFIPMMLKAFRKLMNDETMLIVSLALCFGMVLLATEAGFSSALGAFIMGSILAETVQGERIERLLHPVRDLFGAVFFVSVGMLIDLSALRLYAWPIFLGTLVLLLLKPTFVTVGALISGQPLKTSVQSGMSLSQIGEFSFIIAGLGLSLKVTSDFLYPIAVAISVITAFTTPYMIRLAEPVYRGLQRLLPERVQDSMNRYSAGAQTITVQSDFRLLIRSYLLNIVSNSVIIIAISFICFRWLPPLIDNPQWRSSLTLAVILILSSPFFWALSVRQIQKGAAVRKNRKFRGPLLMLRLLRIAIGLFFIGFICDQLYSPQTALIVAFAIIAVLLMFSKSLKRLYIKIEEVFFHNFYEKEREAEAQGPAKELAPWDAHIANFHIAADNVMSGKTLAELGMREKFGINVAMIERGSSIINSPGRNMMIFPGDRIAAIGTDEQLKAFRNFAEAEETRRDSKQRKEESVLRQIELGAVSPYIHKTIRESFIRENAKGIIVGIERNGERILNPESTMVLEPADRVWIVGNIRRLAAMIRG